MPPSPPSPPAKRTSRKHPPAAPAPRGPPPGPPRSGPRPAPPYPAPAAVHITIRIVLLASMQRSTSGRQAWFLKALCCHSRLHAVADVHVGELHVRAQPLVRPHHHPRQIVARLGIQTASSVSSPPHDHSTLHRGTQLNEDEGNTRTTRQDGTAQHRHAPAAGRRTGSARGHSRGARTPRRPRTRGGSRKPGRGAPRSTGRAEWAGGVRNVTPVAPLAG